MNSVKVGARSFVAGMNKSDVLAPIILLETAVTLGRTYQAHKRGGFIEARERATEETIGAVFWLGGVTAFNKIGDIIGKRLLKLKEIDFDVFNDPVRKPLANFLGANPKHSKAMLGGFKFVKIISSILLANAFVGFLVPKVNQEITKKYQDSIKNKETPKTINFTKSMEEFLKSSTESKKHLAFRGVDKAVEMLLSLTHKFENNAKYKLLSTDVGILAGRTYSARNKEERREIMFRDLSSIYFYMFAKNHMNAGLNKLQLNRARRLDPVTAKQVDTQLQKLFRGKKSAFSDSDFLKYVLGKDKVAIPSSLTFNKDGIVKLEDFLNKGFKKHIQERARKMAKLQPATPEGMILTKNQVIDIFKGGLINDPQFLNEVQSQVSNKKSLNPFKYVSQKELDKVKQDILDYVGDIARKAKDGEVTSELLKKTCKKNFWMNAFNLGSGLLVSAYFLSTAIPKMQYWITKQSTGKDEFPGVKTTQAA